MVIQRITRLGRLANLICMRSGRLTAQTRLSGGCLWRPGCRSTGAAGDQCKLIVKTGGTVYKSGALDLPAAYAWRVGTDYLVNPASGIAWTDADLDALQAGLEVV